MEADGEGAAVALGDGEGDGVGGAVFSAGVQAVAIAQNNKHTNKE